MSIPSSFLLIRWMELETDNLLTSPCDNLLLTAYYTDESEGNITIQASTTADSGTIDPGTGGGGGGCTYNPNSKTFDLSLLMLMALGSLYAFRRRFIK